MSIEAGLFTHLSADAAVAAIAGDRIYPAFQAAQNTSLPYVTMQRVTTTRGHALDGPDGLANVTVQLDCWANTAQVARALANAVRVSIDGFRGSMGAVAVGGVIAQSEQALFEEETRIHRVSTDYSIWHRE